MFAVKILTIIIVALQVANNSDGLPHRMLSGLGILLGEANGLLATAAREARTSSDGTSETENDRTPVIDQLGRDATKRDNPERPSTNCSTGCARKTFRELVFIGKLFQSMENMYGNINARLNEITAESGRAKRSTQQFHGRKMRKQGSTRAKRSQENPSLAELTTKSKFFPEYGVAFHHFASLYPGLRRTFLHIRLEIPSSPPYVHLQPLNRSDCIEMYGRLHLLDNRMPEKGYITMCEESFDTLALFRKQYQKLYDQAKELIQSKFHHFLPNDIVSHTTFSSTQNRTKRGLPGLALAGTMAGVANAIMGIVGKAVNAKANDEKFNALIAASEELLKFANMLANNDIAISNDLSALSHATATGQRHFRERLNNVTTALADVDSNIKRDIKRLVTITEENARTVDSTTTMTRFLIAYTHLFTYKHMPILTVAMDEMRSYIDFLHRFLDGLDELSTGRLTYEILDPEVLQDNLKQLSQKLEENKAGYELVLTEARDYYTSPLLIYTNLNGSLVLQIPIYLKEIHQPPMSLHALETLPVPYDSETYKGTKNQFTQVSLTKDYFAAHALYYVVITESQLKRCLKIRAVYLCENSFLRVNVHADSCESAIYYRKPASTIAKHCEIAFIQNKKHPSKIIDIEDTLVLSNLPKPWILMCNGNRKVYNVTYSTYAIINRNEFCKCSLSAGYDYYLHKTMLSCDEEDTQYSRVANIDIQYVPNKAIFDIMEATFKYPIKDAVRNSLRSISTKIPNYDLHNLNWYETPTSVTDAVMQMDDEHIVVPLQKVLHKVLERSDERIYRTKQDMIDSAKTIRQHLADAAWWHKLEFVSSIAVWVFGALFILSICCFRRSVVSTILGAKVLEEVDMIKVIPGAKAATLPPFPNIPTREPINLPTSFTWGHKEQDTIDAIKDAATKTLSPYQITMLALFAGLILYLVITRCWKHCRHTSFFYRSLFPMIVWSKFHRGSPTTEIVLKIREIGTNKAIWVWLNKVSEFPDDLAATGTIDKDLINITDACCVRIIHCRWNDANIELYSSASKHYYSLPTKGAVSFLSSSKLKSIRHEYEYDIKLMASFLGSTYVIPLLNDSTAASGHSTYELVGATAAGPSSKGPSRIPKVSKVGQPTTQRPIPSPRTKSQMSRQVALDIPEQMAAFQPVAHD